MPSNVTARRPAPLTVEIVSFTAYPDASGAPAVVDVRQGHQTARFALDTLGAEPTCHGLGSGLSTHMTHKAADAARRLYAAKVAELGSDWSERNRAMYSE